MFCLLEAYSVMGAIRHMYRFRKERGDINLLCCLWEGLHGGVGVGAAMWHDFREHHFCHHLCEWLPLCAIVALLGVLNGTMKDRWNLDKWKRNEGRLGRNEQGSFRGRWDLRADRRWSVLRMSKQAVRPGVAALLCCLPVTETWVEGTFWCDRSRSGATASVLIILASWSLLTGGTAVFHKGHFADRALSLWNSLCSWRALRL